MANAGISAGVVTESNLYSQPSAQTGFSLSLNFPATWTTIWVVLSLLYLIGIYMGTIRIAPA